MILTEKLEKFAVTGVLIGSLNFAGGLSYLVLRPSINAPRLDCREPLANPINCVDYETNEQRSEAYTKYKEEKYKAEKVTREWLLFASVPPLLLGAGVYGMADYLRRRKK